MKIYFAKKSCILHHHQAKDNWSEQLLQYGFLNWSSTVDQAIIIISVSIAKILDPHVSC